MGCSDSKSTKVHVQTPRQNQEPKQDGKPESDEQQGGLSKIQIAVVQDTWQCAKNDLQEVGNIFYVRLFEQEPQLLQLFTFRDIGKAENVRSDERARRQALVTMQHVDLAVSSLNNLGAIVPALKDLGARHGLMYNVRDEHYGPVGAALLYTLECGLGEKFTAEAKEAWTIVYGIVADTMKSGAKEAQNSL